MKSKYIYSNLLIIILIFLGIIACDEDGNNSSFEDAEIIEMIPLGESGEENVNSGLPLELIRVEGFNINEMDKIIFDDNINVIFNPALNSNTALFFNVPFDFDNGSRFGVQNVEFISKYGYSIVKQFEIRQPLPIINSNNQYEPEKAVVGEEVIVNGEWFINVSEILIDEKSIDFTVLTDKQLKFIFPEGPTETVELTIVTNGGEITRPLPIEGGFVEKLISDFEGNGIIQSDWFPYGDNVYKIDNGLGNDESRGAELIWDDSGTDEFTGSSHPNFESSITTGTDAENAFLIIDVNVDDYPGTILEFVLEDDQSNWLIKVSNVESGWQTLELKMSDFGFGFDPSNQSNGDVNPSTIKAIKAQISQEGGSGVVPSGYRYDNVKIRVLE